MDGLEVVPEQQKEVHRSDDHLYHISPLYTDLPMHGESPPMTNVNPVQTPSKEICGLKRTTFIILFIVILLAIGGAVGGGVGGSLANKSKSDSASAATSSPSITTASNASRTSSSPVTSGTTGLAANPCPSKNLTAVQGINGFIFTLLCNVDWPYGDAAADGNGTVRDLHNTFAYNLKTCIDRCVEWNEDDTKGSRCKGVKYEANLTAASSGNCWLKDRIGRYYPGIGTSMAAALLGG